MGFVMTREEVARIRATLANPQFVNGEMLEVSFLTDPATVARLLPPPLKPATRPLVSVSVERFQSNCCGDFEGGSVSLLATYGEIEGAYMLCKRMTTEAAIIWGRELIGEPKTMQCSFGWNRQETKMHAWVETQGVRVIEITADVSTNLGPTQASGKAFSIKAFPTLNGGGLEDDAQLLLLDVEQDVKVSRAGQGSVILRGTADTPLDEIEVKEVLEASYVECDLTAHGRTVARIPENDILPYYYGRSWWSELHTEDTLKSL